MTKTQLLRPVAAVGAGLALAVAGVAVPGLTTPASAAGKCVSKAEYRHVHMGMTQKRVRHVLHGYRGKVTYTSTLSTSREYKPCTSPRWGFVSIDFDRYDTRKKRVGYKSAYWG